MKHSVYFFFGPQSTSYYINADAYKEVSATNADGNVMYSIIEFYCTYIKIQTFLYV